MAVRALFPATCSSLLFSRHVYDPIWSPTAFPLPKTSYPSIPDSFSLVRLPDDPAFQGLEYYTFNYVETSVRTPSTVYVDPTKCLSSFPWKERTYLLLQVTSPDRFVFNRNAPLRDWFSYLIRYLESVEFAMPLPHTSSFETPRNPRPAWSGPSSPSSLPLTNRSDALSSPAPMDVPKSYACVVTDPILPPADDSSPSLVFKDKVPPFSIRLTKDSIIPTIKSVLRAGTNFICRPSRITIRASSLEEYKDVLRTAADNDMEFYTYNPVVNHTTKSVLRVFLLLYSS